MKSVMLAVLVQFWRAVGWHGSFCGRPLLKIYILFFLGFSYKNRMLLRFFYNKGLMQFSLFHLVWNCPLHCIWRLGSAGRRLLLVQTSSVEPLGTWNKMSVKKNGLSKEWHNMVHVVGIVLCFRVDLGGYFFQLKGFTARQTSASFSLTLLLEVYLLTYSEVAVLTLTSCLSTFFWVQWLQMFQPFLLTCLFWILLVWQPVNSVITAALDAGSSAL